MRKAERERRDRAEREERKEREERESAERREATEHRERERNERTERESQERERTKRERYERERGRDVDQLDDLARREDVSKLVADAVAAALAAVAPKGYQNPGGQPSCSMSPPREAWREAVDTPPSIVAMKKQIRGLRHAGVQGRDVVQARADAMLLAELEYDLERRQRKQLKYRF